MGHEKSMKFFVHFDYAQQMSVVRCKHVELRVRLNAHWRQSMGKQTQFIRPIILCAARATTSIDKERHNFANSNVKKKKPAKSELLDNWLHLTRHKAILCNGIVRFQLKTSICWISSLTLGVALVKMARRTAIVISHIPLDHQIEMQLLMIMRFWCRQSFPRRVSFCSSSNPTSTC